VRETRHKEKEARIAAEREARAGLKADALAERRRREAERGARGGEEGEVEEGEGRGGKGGVRVQGAASKGVEKAGEDASDPDAMPISGEWNLPHKNITTMGARQDAWGMGVGQGSAEFAVPPMAWASEGGMHDASEVATGAANIILDGEDDSGLGGRVAHSSSFSAGAAGWSAGGDAGAWNASGLGMAPRASGLGGVSGWDGLGAQPGGAGGALGGYEAAFGGLGLNFPLGGIPGGQPMWSASDEMFSAKALPLQWAAQQPTSWTAQPQNVAGDGGAQGGKGKGGQHKDGGVGGRGGAGSRVAG